MGIIKGIQASKGSSHIDIVMTNDRTLTNILPGLIVARLTKKPFVIVVQYVVNRGMTAEGEMLRSKIIRRETRILIITVSETTKNECCKT